MADFVELQKIDDFQPEYDSPITVAYGKAAAEWLDNMVIKEVQRVGFDVDKGKLEQAIRQDKARYEEAYMRGYMKGWNDAKEDEKCEET